MSAAFINIKSALWWFAHFEKFSLTFSSLSFVIYVNLKYGTLRLQSSRITQKQLDYFHMVSPKHLLKVESLPGSKKVSSSCLGQIDFPTRQQTLTSH